MCFFFYLSPIKITSEMEHCIDSKKNQSNVVFYEKMDRILMTQNKLRECQITKGR